jgi:hypothetical protein
MEYAGMGGAKYAIVTWELPTLEQQECRKIALFPVMTSPIPDRITMRKFLFGEAPFGAPNETTLLKINSPLAVSVLPDYIRYHVTKRVSGATKREWEAAILRSLVVITVYNRLGTTVRIRTP